MPPKPNDKKKGDNEDFSDSANLPAANVFKFTIVHKSYFQSENRDKVKKAIVEKLGPTSLDRVKTLSRDDITNYAKSKAMAVDEEGLARACTDRLFEISIQFRRQRKERMNAEGENFDPDLVDGFIFLTDYPTQKSEVLALSRYGSSLNAVFEIEEIQSPQQKSEDDESGESNAEESAREEPPKIQNDSQEARQVAMDIFNAFKNARHESDPKSPLRQLAFLRVAFVNAQQSFQVTESGGTIQEKVRSAEDCFVSQLTSNFIDKYGQYLVQYQKFKRLVTVEPLMPDQQAIKKIKEIKAENKRNAAWLQDANAELEIHIKELEDSKADSKNKDDIDRTDKEIEITRARFSQMRQEKEQRAGNISKELNELMKRTTISLDDERDYSNFSLAAYKNDFVADPEVANSIGSVLSAMVTQIEKENEPQFVAKAEDISTTDASALDDLFDHYLHEISCDLQFKSRGQDVKRHNTDSRQIKQVQISIDDEMDTTLNAKQNLPLDLQDQEQHRLLKIQERERGAYNNLNLPGKDRHLMPPRPSQSKLLRDAQNPEFYPFCTLSHDEAERMLVLKNFQQLIRSNLIDYSQPVGTRHSKYKVFERTFEHHMQPEIFRQVFATALLDEPDMASLYYPRQDSLLVALFNKANRNTRNNESKAELMPKPVRQIDLSINSQDIDGERKWRAAYKVLPDFENWLAYFADEVVLEQDSPVVYQKPVEATPPPAGKPGQAPLIDAVDPNCIPVTFFKYSIDEENLPESMLRVEDDKIQSISEKSAFLYPDDNSVMRVDHFTVGGRQFSKSFIQKDNIRFGLRQRQGPATQKVEYGLVRQQAVGDTEFWLNFDNGTKLGIEQIQIERNPQQTIKIEPKQPSPEEVAFKLEQQKKLAEATAKATKANKPPPTDIVVPETPQPIWEQAPLNFLDRLFSDEIIGTSQARGTLTMKNGLVVYYLGSGNVCQFDYNLRHGEERDRIVTPEGIVVRQMANHDAQLLFPDGVYASFSRKEMKWIITNNKGMVRSFQDGEYTDLPAIPAAIETDAVTGARMLIREDDVVTVRFKDGSSYCRHHDGTQMHTSADGSEIRIEKQGLASHSIKINKSSEFEDPYGRSISGRVIETYLPDGTMSCSWLDTVNTKNFGDTEVFRHMLYRPDLSVVHFDSIGHVSIISSNARAALNELGEKKKLNQLFKDSDYLIDLKRAHGMYTPQVYRAHIYAVDGKSNIKTKNTLDNTQFVLKQDLTLQKVQDQIELPADERTLQQQKAQTKRQLAKVMKEATDLGQQQKQIYDMQIEPTGSYKEPNQRYFDLPRLFVVNADGSARELLAEEQFEYDKRKKGLRHDLTIHNKLGQVINNQHIESTAFITKVENTSAILTQQTKLNSIKFPKNAEQVLREKTKSAKSIESATTDFNFLFKQIFKMCDCDTLKQSSFADDYQRYLEWKMSQVRYNTEFALVHVAASKDEQVDWSKIEEEEFYSKRINTKILKLRSNPAGSFDGNVLKNYAIQVMKDSGSIEKLRSNQTTIDKKKEQITNVKVSGSLSDLKKQKKSKDLQERKQRFQQKLNQLEEQKAMVDFLPIYFSSESGIDFLTKNPQKPPSQEVLVRMQQRLQRKNNDSQTNMANKMQQDDENDGNFEERDNPIVALEPDELKQGSHFTGSKRLEKSQIQENGQTKLDPANMPSLYMQEKLYLYQKEQEALLKSEEHHIVKTKDFNVIGRLREEKPFVKSIQRSTANSELNEKFITTEVITDRRVKISSMAPRFYMNAPSVEQVRKQGQHQMILSAINKKQTFGELINQANSMVTAVLHDNLKRSLNVMPGAVTFGALKTGTFNEILMTVKNEDSLAHRITIKPLKDTRIIVKQLEYGIIAPGMIRTISVGIRVADDERPCLIKDTVEIVSKHDIFKIPLTARIVSIEDFETENRLQMQTSGNPIQNSRVRERLLRKIEESKQEDGQDGPVILTRKPEDDDFE